MNDEVIDPVSVPDSELESARKRIDELARAYQALERDRRAIERDVAVAIYTAEMFDTGDDDANRAAVREVATTSLDLVGIGFRAPQRLADQMLRGLKRHP